MVLCLVCLVGWCDVLLFVVGCGCFVFWCTCCIVILCMYWVLVGLCVGRWTGYVGGVVMLLVVCLVWCVWFGLVGW